MITALLLSPALDTTYLVDRVEPGAIHRPRAVLHRAGGKALNLARAARVLGGAVRVVAPLGGRHGELVADLARAEGLHLVTVPVAAESRVCLTVVPDGGEPATEFYETAPGLAPSVLDAVGAALEASPADGWTAFAGSSPAGVDAGAVAQLLELRRAAGDRLAVDTSGALLANLLQLAPELVKVNRAEAAAIAGEPGATALDLATELAVRTGGTAVVTDGAAGAAAAGPAGRFRVLPPATPGRYPVGSGDSFLAGLLVAAERGEPLPGALVLAASAAAANTRRPGAGGFDADDLDAARAGTRVEPVP